MGYRFDNARMNEIIKALGNDYHIFAPKQDSKKRQVRFKPITSVEEIERARQSDFSAKEVFYPVSTTMFYFKDGTITESVYTDDKGILIFARPCDINAIKRLDNIFLKNGASEDKFYRERREKVKFILMECTESFENCFCVSMGSEKTDDYAVAVRFGDDHVLINIKDEEFARYFEGGDTEEFELKFVKENAKKAAHPKLGRENIKEVSSMEFWNRFDEKCIACGGCNTVCPTCACFDTVDVVYTESANEGERRRVWSSCMLEDFTKTAGGALSRKTHGANMRFKVFHKFYDYEYRFEDGNMCVGCGRCDMRCPRDISFYDTVNLLADEIS